MPKETDHTSAATVERVWVFPAAYVVLLAENTAVSDTLRRLA